mgnify:FL=1
MAGTGGIFAGGVAKGLSPFAQMFAKRQQKDQHQILAEIIGAVSKSPEAAEVYASQYPEYADAIRQFGKQLIEKRQNEQNQKLLMGMESKLHEKGISEPMLSRMLSLQDPATKQRIQGIMNDLAPFRGGAGGATGGGPGMAPEAPTGPATPPGAGGAAPGFAPMPAPGPGALPSSAPSSLGGQPLNPMTQELRGSLGAEGIGNVGVAPVAPGPRYQTGDIEDFPPQMSQPTAPAAQAGVAQQLLGGQLNQDPLEQLHSGLRKPVAPYEDVDIARGLGQYLRQQPIQAEQRKFKQQQELQGIQERGALSRTEKSILPGLANAAVNRGELKEKKAQATEKRLYEDVDDLLRPLVGRLDPTARNIGAVEDPDVKEAVGQAVLRLYDAAERGLLRGGPTDPIYLYRKVQGRVQQLAQESQKQSARPVAGQSAARSTAKELLKGLDPNNPQAVNQAQNQAESMLVQQGVDPAVAHAWVISQTKQAVAAQSQLGARSFQAQNKLFAPAQFRNILSAHPMVSAGDKRILTAKRLNPQAEEAVFRRYGRMAQQASGATAWVLNPDLLGELR